MTNLNDHPDIAAAMRTGYPRGKTARMRCCPNYGEELTLEELIYINETGEAIGCETCVEIMKEKTMTPQQEIKAGMIRQSCGAKDHREEALEKTKTDNLP